MSCQAQLSQSVTNNTDKMGREKRNDKNNPSVTPEVKHVSDIIGDWGLWQSNIAVFCVTVAVFSAFHGMVPNFYQPKIDYQCTDSQFVEYWSSSNISCDKRDECELPDGTKCTSWKYLNGQMNITAVTEFDWVCSSSWLGSFSVTIYMAGVMAAAFIFGIASDLIGRKKCVIVAFTIEIASGLLSAFAATETMFLVSRGLLGFGCYGRNITGFLIALETVGTKYRAVMGVAIQLGWALGTVLLPPIAYYTQSYKTCILVTTLPEILWMIWLLFIIPESPRWLLNKRRFEEAKVIIESAAKMNGKDASHVDEQFSQLIINLKTEDESVPGNDSVFTDLWQSRELIIYTLVFYLLWFTNAFVYYGISLNISDLGGDLFWDAFWSGLIEFPAYLFCMGIFKYVGRRPLLVVTMIGAGLASFAVIPFYTFLPMNRTIVDIFAFSGKFCVTCSFALIYVYSAEVYPTVLRQIGVGSCSIVARIGSFISPFMKEMTAYTNFGVTMAIYGVLSLVSGLAAIALPETKDKDIPDRVKDVKGLRAKSQTKSP